MLSVTIVVFVKFSCPTKFSEMTSNEFTRLKESISLCKYTVRNDLSIVKVVGFYVMLISDTMRLHTNRVCCTDTVNYMDLTLMMN